MKRAVRVVALVLAALSLTACIEMQQPSAPPPASRAVTGPVGVSTLQQVAQTLMPVAESECRARVGGGSCAFRVVLDQDPRAPANAFQSLTRDGQPQITVTQKLLDDLRNRDELAFILGHEAAHHILGHIRRASSDATVGAVLGGVLASALGGGAGSVDMAQQVGATVGGRAYSKQYELQADRLGARIAERAGYDPLRGVEYFNRIPDPGNAFLGSHPPNAERIAAVRQAVAGN